MKNPILLPLELGFKELAIHEAVPEKAQFIGGCPVFSCQFIAQLAEGPAHKGFDSGELFRGELLLPAGQRIEIAAASEGGVRSRDGADRVLVNLFVIKVVIEEVAETAED